MPITHKTSVSIAVACGMLAFAGTAAVTKSKTDDNSERIHKLEESKDSQAIAIQQMRDDVEHLRETADRIDKNVQRLEDRSNGSTK